MVRNGGRNGVVLSVGFRWELGKDYSKEKVNNKIYTVSSIEEKKKYDTEKNLVYKKKNPISIELKESPIINKQW